MAIARGLAGNPSILLLDEPFGALDALTRIQMQKEILRIQREEKVTMVMVTHDIDEAIYLGERIDNLSARAGRNSGDHHYCKYSRMTRRQFRLCRIQKENLRALLSGFCGISARGRVHDLREEIP